MVLLVIFYVLLLSYEWMYARRKKMNRKVKIVVMVTLGFSFLYAASQIVRPYSLSPNPWLEGIFRPLSHIIWKD